ncbi:MAG: cupredoxin domain-containing protein [Actinomycetota bacterium]
MSRRFLVGLCVAVVAVTSSAFADPPIYDPKVIKPVGDAIASPHGQQIREALGPAGSILDAGACTPESNYEWRPSGLDYGDKCRRLRVVFGPILNKPGQDDVLIQPVTFEKPLYDGYIVRFKPNLVNQLGVTPPVESVHLHHGTWINAYPQYGSGPFFASGEEKTISSWPYRYGMRVGAMDSWLFLHMVHNATTQTYPVYVLYDLDFVAAEDGDAVQADGKPLITNARNIWLDAGGGPFHPETETYFLNPIFNIQRGFGAAGECRFPDLNCAGFNSSGNVSAQQGKDFSPDVHGKDFTITKEALGGESKGTLILMGGHVHNGGLRTEVELVRDGVSKLINISDAYYWQDDPNVDRIGNRPVSWDYSMTGSTLDHGWAVNVQEGDILRLNGIYDTAIGSWYEQMAIVMSWVVPGGIPEGLDVFDPSVVLDPSIPSVAIVPNGPDGSPLAHTCVASATRLCQRGQVTHGQIPTSGNHGSNPGGEPTLWEAAAEGQHLNDVLIGGFTFGLTDMGIAGSLGVPYINLGESISFHNLDTAAYMWHTITRCAAPCMGPTTVDYPIADGGGGVIAGAMDPMDFDSTQLGIGAGPSQRVSWTFTPTETGTFTFFCRVHPSMRGVFRVK